MWLLQSLGNLSSPATITWWANSQSPGIRFLLEKKGENSENIYEPSADNRPRKTVYITKNSNNNKNSNYYKNIDQNPSRTIQKQPKSDSLL